MSKLELEMEGETTVVVRRRFAAPPEAVYRAHIEPKMIQQWMLGPEGWTMPVCISKPEPGGEIRFEWSDGAGAGFYLTGHYIELEPSHRIVHVERMHLPDATPDNRIVTTFTADGDGTLLVARMELPSAEARKAMLESGMDVGMEQSYARLDALPASAASTNGA